MFIWRPSGQRDRGVVIKKGQKYSCRFPLTDLYVTAKIKRIFPENKPSADVHQTPSGRLKPATSGERESQDEFARRFLLLINFKVLKSCFFVPDSWSCRGLPSLSAENKLSLLFYARSFSGTFLLFFIRVENMKEIHCEGSVCPVSSYYQLICDILTTDLFDWGFVLSFHQIKLSWGVGQMFIPVMLTWWQNSCFSCEFRLVLDFIDPEGDLFSQHSKETYR